MQFVDKNENASSSSDNWRKKVSPIPSFLQETTPESLLPTEEKGGSPLMKGILYTILTATIGVLVGYIISYIMRAPQASTMQALEELVSKSDTILAGATAGSKSDAKADAKGDKKEGAKSPLITLIETKTATISTPAAAATPGTTLAPSPSTDPTPPTVATSSTPTLPPQLNAKPSNTTTAAPAPAAGPTKAEPPKEASKEAQKAAKKPIPQGPVFLIGTNPYGPPPLVEQDLFNPSTLLKVEQDPSEEIHQSAYQANAVEAPTFNELLQTPSGKPAPTAPTQTASSPNNFQVQFGAFSSRVNANHLANRLQAKGYEVNIYEGWTRNGGAWYYVRLGKDYDHTTALETAKNIQSTEKLLPMVVQPTNTEKKLR